MERGVYFDGWFKHNYCYHPSLPLRSSQMLEDLEKKPRHRAGLGRPGRRKHQPAVSCP